MPRPRRLPKRPHPKAIAAAAHRQDDAGPDKVVCLLCGEEFRAISWRHLRARHGFEGPHPVEDYKARFGLRVASSEETCEQHRSVRVGYWKERGQHWTKARVKRELRDRQAAGDSLANHDAPMALVNACHRLFGSWRAAVESIGADPLDHRCRVGWNEERVVSEIRRRGTPQTRKSAKWARENHGDLFKAAITVLGRWSRALELAGLDPEEHREERRIWTREACREYVRRRVRDGVAPSVVSLPGAMYASISTQFEGGWHGLVASLGARPRERRKRMDWSKAAVVREIRERRAAGEPLHAEAVKREGRGLWSQGHNRFGSWDAALQAAGVAPNSVKRRRDWTRQDVLDALRGRARRGRSLHYRAVEADEPRLYRAVRRLMPGSWDAALAEAGLAAPRQAPRAGRKK